MGVVKLRDDGVGFARFCPELGAAVVAPVPAFAYSGLGCTNLPAYDRAVGALQGMPGACDMTVEEAKRIVAAHDRENGVPPVARSAHIRQQ